MKSKTKQESKPLVFYGMGDMARAAGVSIITVYHNYKTGLLKPHIQTKSGNVLFTEEEAQAYADHHIARRMRESTRRRITVV